MPAKGVYLTFQKARSIVWKVGLKNQKEWKAWSKSGKHAVFLGKRNDGRMFTVNPRAPHQAAELSWDTDDIAEICGGGSP